jgi:uncharacterized alkaline shock family protein YloU
MEARNAMNRGISFLVGACAVAAGTVVILVTSNAIKTGTLAPSGWFRDQFVRLDDLSGRGESLAIAIGAAAIAVGAVLALIELLPARNGTREFFVRDAIGNAVSLPPETVSMVAEQAAREVNGVVNADMSVSERADGVAVMGNVTMLDDLSPAEKTNEISQRVRAALEQRIGVKVAAMQVRMHLVSAAQVERDRERETRHGWFPWSRHEHPAR